MKAPFKHFDLPTQHLTGNIHYTPPKARQADEIDRRRSLPKGSILAEQQAQGLQIAAFILSQVEEKPDIEFAARIIAVSGLNSAWYGFAQRSPVMRRRLLLPYLAAEANSEPLNSSEQLTVTRDSLHEAAIAADGLRFAIYERSPQRAALKTAVGRGLGNVSLRLACLPIGETFSAQSNSYTVQRLVRERGLETLEAARQIGAELGTPPSVAQLVDPNSDLSVYIRRNAPNGVYAAYDKALANSQAA